MVPPPSWIGARGMAWRPGRPGRVLGEVDRLCSTAGVLGVRPAGKRREHAGDMLATSCREPQLGRHGRFGFPGLIGAQLPRYSGSRERGFVLSSSKVSFAVLESAFRAN